MRKIYQVVSILAIFGLFTTSYATSFDWDAFDARFDALFEEAPSGETVIDGVSYTWDSSTDVIQTSENTIAPSEAEAYAEAGTTSASNAETDTEGIVNSEDGVVQLTWHTAASGDSQASAYAYAKAHAVSVIVNRVITLLEKRGIVITNTVTEIVEKVVEKIVEVEIERIVEVEKPVYIEKIVEKIVEVEKPIYIEKIVEVPGETVYIQLPGETVYVEIEKIVEVPGETVYVQLPGETVYVEVPGETVYVEVPGETVYVEVPVEKFIEVEVPGETVYIEVPGETVYVEVPGETVYIDVPVEKIVEKIVEVIKNVCFVREAYRAKVFEAYIIYANPTRLYSTEVLLPGSTQGISIPRLTSAPEIPVQTVMMDDIEFAKLEAHIDTNNDGATDHLGLVMIDPEARFLASYPAFNIAGEQNHSLLSTFNPATDTVLVVEDSLKQPDHPIAENENDGEHHPDVVILVREVRTVFNYGPFIETACEGIPQD